GVPSRSAPRSFKRSAPSRAAELRPSAPEHLASPCKRAETERTVDGRAPPVATLHQSARRKAHRTLRAPPDQPLLDGVRLPGSFSPLHRAHPIGTTASASGSGLGRHALAAAATLATARTLIIDKRDALTLVGLLRPLGIRPVRASAFAPRLLFLLQPGGCRARRQREQADVGQDSATRPQRTATSGTCYPPWALVKG